MDSIFRAEDSRLYPELGFWRVCESMQTPITLEGCLFQGTGKGLLVSHYMALAGTMLYQLGTVVLGVDLRWKQVSTKQAEGLGLALCVDDQLVLYFPDQREAERWTQAIRAVAISAGYDSQYEELKFPASVARVCFAKSRKEQTTVAVKKYSCAELRATPSKYKRLIQEIDISRRVTHPNVGKLIGVYESDTCIALVSEYISGGTLLDRLQTKGKLEEGNAREIAISLLHGIAHLHEIGVIHRDIKLENVLIDDRTDGHLSSVIIDFGLATYAKEDRGTICGTPGYVAPELLFKRQYSEKVDIYSAGIVLYMILSDSSPFPGDTESAILARNKRSHITFSSKSWEGVPTQARNLVLRMTESDPLLRISAQQALKHPWLQPRSSTLNVI